MFFDTFPGMPYTFGNNFSITIVLDDKEKIKKYFDRLKVDGKVEMEFIKTEWSDCYGSLVDKFGIGWQFSYR